MGSTSRFTSATCEWLWNVVHLDLGNSYIYQDPVWDVIKSRFPVSLFLGLTGFLLSYLVCVPLGVSKAVKHGSRTSISCRACWCFWAIPCPAGRWDGAAGAVRRRQFLGVFPLGGFRSDNWEYLTLWQKGRSSRHGTCSCRCSAT